MGTQSLVLQTCRSCASNNSWSRHLAQSAEVVTILFLSGITIKKGSILSLGIGHPDGQAGNDPAGDFFEHRVKVVLRQIQNIPAGGHSACLSHDFEPCPCADVAGVAARSSMCRVLPPDLRTHGSWFSSGQRTVDSEKTIVYRRSTINQASAHINQLGTTYELKGSIVAG